jgi:NADPH-dependent 2,4-dienoyl-CoA reductase/sulfur reductase-like enzyme
MRRTFRLLRSRPTSSPHWGRRVTTISTVLALTAVGVVQATSQSPSDNTHVERPDPATFPRIPSRQEQLSALKAGGKFDVLIIGGGASGAGTALDAASRGLKVALVERDDFACGTSSRSTKLVHGGVRYLEKAFRVYPNGLIDLGIGLWAVQVSSGSIT